MTTIKLSESEPSIMIFDANVLELFKKYASYRIPVSWIDKIELTTDKKGKHDLEIHSLHTSGTNGYTVDENAFQKVTQLIAEIERAKAVFNFD